MDCDIAEMYPRIGIGMEDKPYHRFLWRGNTQDRSPDVYKFDRVVFGINSSPFLAQFVLQHHAREHQADYGRATETILKSTYMDDSWLSFVVSSVSLSLSHWYPGSGVVLDCIDS